MLLDIAFFTLHCLCYIIILSLKGESNFNKGPFNLLVYIFGMSGNYPDEERKLVDPVNGTEYVPTYEDKEGDWMLVGDVPWK